MTSTPPPSDTAEQLRTAGAGFDAIFGDDIVKAKEICKFNRLRLRRCHHFDPKRAVSVKTSPFHELGFGTVIFLQAALGMEASVI